MTMKGAVLATNPPPKETRVSDSEAKALKRSTARGALVSVGGQAAIFVLRTGSMVILARLLGPNDFGLVGMVTAVTGFLGLFKDAGLSAATVQRVHITSAQTSTLFWVNLALGTLLAVVCAGLAPAIVAFYGNPRLFWVTVALGSTFIFSGAAAQHRAMLQRGMRFGITAVIDIVALILSTALGIGMAAMGLSYWALVWMTISYSALGTLGAWLAVGWIPSRPERGSGIRSLLHFGGTVTLNGLVVYLAYNTDKILLGRFWGAEVLGLYGRAYQLVNVATDNLCSSIGSVAFPALSRLQNDAPRLRSYFLKGYSLFLSLVLPVTIWCALFAEDIVLVMLGPKWGEAAGIFRWLAPSILALALVSPFSWLMLGTGRVRRSLMIAVVVTPVVILGYALGLYYGARGVAAGFSFSMALAVIPVMLWAKHGTLITMWDVFRLVVKPFLSATIAASVAITFSRLENSIQPAFLRLFVATSAFFGVYLLVLLFVMKQNVIYLAILRETGIWRQSGRKAA
jgi:PST family polysaccharide transporter